MDTNERSASDTAKRLIDNATEGILGPNPFVGFRVQDLAGAFTSLAKRTLGNPGALLEQEAALLRDFIAIASGTSELGPTAGDKRFADPAWQGNSLYKACLQGYLAWTGAMQRFVDNLGFEDRAKQRVQFAVSLVSDAVAPTNTLLGNPAALKKTIDSGGASLVAGIRNMAQDMATNGWMPAQVDKSAFTLGENIAVSKGAVVFTSPVLELIQYAPQTESVHTRPHLFVPPQINKFYFFDLAPGRSMVEHLTQAGFQTYAISWRNPTAAERDWDMDTYVKAIGEAIEAIQEITGSPDVIVHAACSGAMTATITAALMRAKEQRLIHALTLMVAVIGAGPDSQLGLFATPETIAAARMETSRRGVLEGSDMGRVFAWMRPNDLVWNYWANNYLMGNAPPAFDILYWNNDTTRLPAKFHATLLDIFVNDALREPGRFVIEGTPVDLSLIDCDKFVVAGLTDHITPWRDVYRMAQTLGGDTEFVLGSSGHIQTLISPAGGGKAKYFLNPQAAPSADEWLEAAKPHAGSWWNHWSAWLAERSGEQREAPARLGSDRHPPCAPAPGLYVRAK